MREAGVDEQIIAMSGVPLLSVTEIAGQMDLTGYVVGLILVMLLFFCVYFYGYGVAMSVANEKTSRVMETLVVSAKPSRILIGKVLAMGAVGLLQFLGILATAALCYTFILPEGAVLFGAPLSFAAFTPGVAALVVVYFILGYILYAVLNSVCGATVSKIEDLNTGHDAGHVRRANLLLPRVLLRHRRRRRAGNRRDVSALLLALPHALPAVEQRSAGRRGCRLDRPACRDDRRRPVPLGPDLFRIGAPLRRQTQMERRVQDETLTVGAGKACKNGPPYWQSA